MVSPVFTFCMSTLANEQSIRVVSCSWLISRLNTATFLLAAVAAYSAMFIANVDLPTLGLAATIIRSPF